MHKHIVPVLKLQKSLVVALLFLCFQILFCAPQLAGYKVDVLFEGANFSGEVLSGREILVLPLLRDSGFDTVGLLAPQSLAQWFVKERKDLKISINRDFEKQFAHRHKRPLLRAFYEALYAGDILAVKSMDTVINSIKSRFFLTVRFISGAKIISLDKKVKRRVTLEAELWDTDIPGVVWRSSLYGMTMDKTITDPVFLRKALENIYRKIPEVPHFINIDEDW